ncbi:MAG: CDGSH iron-sulfur domain-containing protein [Candidatus Anstonellales archaeon]
MSRVVRKEEYGPIEIKVGGESRWICMCGLSKNGPFCDGSHQKTKGEEEGVLYEYMPDGRRRKVKIQPI